jgi:large conductance mechanosensitive channel
MIQEFKEFVARGNVLMLAVGFIMGVAFSAVVTSLVEDLIMPIIAIPFGQPDFTALSFEVNDSVIRYGSLLTAIVIFLLTALAVFFFIVKPYNMWLKRHGEDDEEQGPTELEVLIDIRDALARRDIR